MRHKNGDFRRNELLLSIRTYLAVQLIKTQLELAPLTIEIKFIMLICWYLTIAQFLRQRFCSDKILSGRCCDHPNFSNPMSPSTSNDRPIFHRFSIIFVCSLQSIPITRPTFQQRKCSYWISLVANSVDTHHEKSYQPLEARAEWSNRHQF